MSNTSIFAKRFAELELQLRTVEATKRHGTGPYNSSSEFVDRELLLGWKVKARSLIASVCGQSSEHYKEFVKCEDKRSSMRTTAHEFKELRAVFFAAKEDYEGGYLNSLRNLVQAEVFGSELEQAKELLSTGYKAAAAVIAGVVLETTIRQLCAEANIPSAKLDRMNAELAKIGAYNTLVQKRITALADIRNNAARGHPEQFKESDVADMISYVESFVSERL